MKSRNILIILVILIAQIGKRTTGEWVEIPQFSDGEKVYRIPFTKYDTSQKLYAGSTEATTTIHGFSNATTIIRGSNKIHVDNPPESMLSWMNKPTGTSSGNVETNKIYANKPSGFSQSWMNKPTGAISVDSPQTSVTEETIYLPGNGLSSTFPTPHNIEDLSDENNFADVTVEEDNEEGHETASTVRYDNQIVVRKNQTGKPSVSQETSESDEDNNSNRSFLYFIPVELFKKVHATLMAQPATLKGKMHFLKNFEKALLAEIQKRLIPVVTPVRTKRESRGDHYDDHEESVGFPSLEGALMAISFLTFAVYLVQLVMMLFRNLGTTPPANPGTATVLFNRNKRSFEEFNEHTARVLEYMDKYAKIRSNND